MWSLTYHPTKILDVLFHKVFHCIFHAFYYSQSIFQILSWKQMQFGSTNIGYRKQEVFLSLLLTHNVFLWKYFLLVTLLSNFLVNFLVIFLLGSIWKVIFDTKKFGSKDNIFIWKTVFLWKNCLLITLLPNFLVAS